MTALQCSTRKWSLSRLVISLALLMLPRPRDATMQRKRGASFNRGAVFSAWVAPAAPSSSRGLGRSRRRKVAWRAYSPLASGGASVELESFGGGEALSDDLSTAPVDMEQKMSSLKPDWGTTEEEQAAHAQAQRIKGSMIDPGGGEFPHPVSSFPKLVNSEIYYNGTTAAYWWNQDSEKICVYVPVTPETDRAAVDFSIRPRGIRLAIDGVTIVEGTPFRRLLPADCLWLMDKENEPPFLQLELYKEDDFQNWPDLLREGSVWAEKADRAAASAAVVAEGFAADAAAAAAAGG